MWPDYLATECAFEMMGVVEHSLIHKLDIIEMLVKMKELYNLAAIEIIELPESDQKILDEILRKVQQQWKRYWGRCSSSSSSSG